MSRRNLVASFAVLITSSATLICCALPALLVTLGLGAVLAGVVAHAPWLGVLSSYKLVIFIIAGIMLLVAGIMMYGARNKSCPVDQAYNCNRVRLFSIYMYVVSVVIYLIGLFFAYIAVHLFY